MAHSASSPITSKKYIDSCFASLLAAASALIATTRTAPVRKTAIPHARASDPLSISTILSCPAPLTRATPAARFIAESVFAAAEIAPKPAFARLGALPSRASITPGVLLACSDCIGVNPLWEVRDVHNVTEVADSLGVYNAGVADHSLGLGLGD